MEAKEEEKTRRSFYHETIRVELRHFPALLGREGNGFRKYREKHDVHIKIPARVVGPQEREIPIAIVGCEHSVKAAKEDMLTFLTQLDTQSFIEVNVDRVMHPTIIGYKGTHVTQIRKQYNVKIFFPEKGESDVVKISGAKENVEKTKRYLLHLEAFYMGNDRNCIVPEDLEVGEQRQSASHFQTTANQADGATGSGVLSSKRPSWDLPK